MISDTEALAQLALFRNVPEKSLDALVRRTRPIDMEPGYVVFREGEAADTALLVVEGRLEACVGDPPRRVGDAAPGEVIGETALFVIDGKRSATVIARQPSRCLVISRKLLLAGHKNAAVQALELHMMGTLARRIRWTNQSIQRVWKEVATQEAAVTQSEEGSLRGKLRRLFMGA